MTLSDDSLAREALGRLLEACTARDLRIGLAESLTGGLAAFLLIDQPGAGDIVCGSLVTYHTATKRRLLGYHGPVVSRPCAAAMAEGACRMLGADVGISLTGVAGPSRQEAQPVGTVFIGVSTQGRTDTMELSLQGEPNRIRLDAITAAANLARRQVLPRPAVLR